MKKQVAFLIVTILLVLGACTPATPAPTLTPTPIPTAALLAAWAPSLTVTPAPFSPSSAVISTSTLEPTSTPTPQPRQWWQDAVFYEIFVRSFYDSNGDGIGDFNGITQKLDYLQSLGVTGLWLMPIFPSPSYHGYDVTDYYNVNPQYGSLDDLKNLLAQAHKRGMHVIVDLILNHTSNRNPWFVSSNNSLQSPFRAWYVWSETTPSSFQGPNGIAWFPGKYGFYYGAFGADMPDLNYRNPAVTAEMEKVIAFWLKDIGMDGFRLDAINYLIEEGQKQLNTQSTHNWLKEFYTTYKADDPNAFTVGEIYGSDATMAKTYTGNQMDMVFNFEMASSFINSANGQSNSAVDSALTFAKQAMPSGQFATFLTNHDQERTMSVLNGSLDKAKMAAFLLLTSPGTPFIYYGEEIGMEGEKPDPDIRRPMQWAGDARAGFTSSTPWESLGANFQTANVANETNDPNSLLSFYRTMVTLRNHNIALRAGDLALISTSNPGVYAALRHSDSETEQTVLILANLTDKPISSYFITLSNSTLTAGTYSMLPILGPGPAADLTAASSGGFSQYIPIPDIPAYGTMIFQLLLK